MEYYFEQLRNGLRHGDQQESLKEALIMCEKKMPAGCVIPDDNHDWSAKMVEECIVGSWATARVKTAKSMSSSSNYPLLSKLLGNGIEDINVVIKGVDFKYNIVLAEYVDNDTLQMHSVWFPVNALFDPQIPLPPPAASCSLNSLTRELEEITLKVDAVYARLTLLQFFFAWQR